MNKYKDRVKEFKRIPYNKIKHHANNWRKHPVEQVEALNGIMAEVGFAGAVIVYEEHDGSYRLIDGHLRAEMLQQEEDIPAIVLNVTPEEADKLLTVYDPISALAQIDAERFNELAKDLRFEQDALNELLNSTARKAGLDWAIEHEDQSNDFDPFAPKTFAVICEFRDEDEQNQFIDEMLKRGVKCKSLIS